MTMLQQLSTWPQQRWPWLLLALSAVFFEAAALYFQYAQGLEPCVMCIYQRVAVFGVLFAAIPAAINPESNILRGISFVLWIIAAIWGWQIAADHSAMQDPANFMMALSCESVPQFPSWMPLHDMLPGVFEPRGMCGDIKWSFLGLSMPQTMEIIFALYSFLAIGFSLTWFSKNK